MNRNDMAHIFSTSVGQVWMKIDTNATKNMCLLDLPILDLEDGYKEKLIVVLEDLAIDMPNGLHALENTIPMHAYFFTTVFHESVLAKF